MIFAQERQEGHPGDYPGYFNYLNIPNTTATSLGLKYTPGAYGFASFGSLKAGEDAAIKEYQSPAINLPNESGKTIAQQISDIAGSGWASSHYGGAGGPNLVNTFKSIYPNVDLGTASSTKVSVTPGGGTTTGGGPFGIVGDITGTFTSITDAFKFLFSYRFLEILGGGLFVLLGLYLLSKQFGNTLGVPKPPAADAFEQGFGAGDRQVSRSSGRREATRRASGSSATTEANLAGQRAERATADL